MTDRVWLAIRTSIGEEDMLFGKEPDLGVFAFRQREGATAQLRMWAATFYSGTDDPAGNARSLVQAIDDMPHDGGSVVFGCGHHVFLKHLAVHEGARAATPALHAATTAAA
jgi:hypothetical protein